MANNIKAAVLGFIVWLIVLIIMRLLGDTVFSEGNPLLVLFYIACFPVGLVFNIGMRILMGLPMKDMLKPMAILVIVAVMMDGFSFAFTHFYGIGDHEIYSAAFLLWAPGVFLLCGLWQVSRAEQQHLAN